MTRNLNLPEVEKAPKRDRGAKGCAVVVTAWLLAMAALAAIALTGGLARLAMWAVGA